MEGKDEFSLDSLSVCESIEVDERSVKKGIKNGIFDEEIREFLGFVVRKISNNSDGLNATRC